ncbi:hypothetical protein [Parasitella parasitica]|uniref:cAMP-dependent protein kinase regulatory subunit n=1 Tax=Parasitella parasitica TaxID=35722 RepID=A0A0B7NFI1_9FUNG|nr:hypothetical protein [Parasitella parasitica]
MSHPQEVHPFAQVDNQEYNLLISELNRQVVEHQPEDLLQFCTTFFLKKLEEERAESRQYDQHPLAINHRQQSLGPDFHPSFEDQDMHDDEERDTISDEMPSLSVPPSSRGRRTSVSAESMQPSDNQEDFVKVVIPKSQDQRARIRTAIGNNFLFKNLDEEQYTDVVNAMAEKREPANTHVIEQGAVGDYFYIVESGNLDCFINDKKVTSYGPGGSFGELALMYNAPRAASIITVTDSVLYALDRVTFRSILMENTARKRRMYERFLEEVPIFKSLEVYERHKIADALESVNFEDKEVVIQEGDTGENFYLIESGEATFYKKLPDGTQKEVMVGKKGDYFGGKFYYTSVQIAGTDSPNAELALLNDEPRAATVVANGRLKCATLGKKAFTRLLGPVMDILKRNSENYHAVLQQVNHVLLQGNYFTAVDLAEIGQELDRQEQLVGGRKNGSESQNYDDSGYFSIQILQKALEIWNLELIPWKSKEMDEARKAPTQQNAYICNLRNHWFTLRKFAETYRWYNLDSTQPAPTYLGEDYLALMLHQIECEGYSVFVVNGTLPQSEGDRKARAFLKPQGEGKVEGKPLPDVIPFSGHGYSLTASSIPEQAEDDEETALAKAIQASMESNKPTIQDDMDEIRKRRLARFGGQ